MPPTASWRQPTRYPDAPVISDLGDDVTTLLVPAAEWESYRVAAQIAPGPARVILVSNGPPPHGVQGHVDAVVSDDETAIASAVRVTDSELIDLLSGLTDTELAQVTLATSLHDLPELGDVPVEAVDLPRLARIAWAEGQARVSFDEPAQRLLAVSATMPKGYSARPPELVAAALLLALLRSGMRMAGGAALRGASEPDETPTLGDVAFLLGEKDVPPLSATIPDAALAFSLAVGGRALVVESSDKIDVRVTSDGELVWGGAGRRIEIPLDRLSSPGTTVRIGAADWRARR